jgi:hypothetical protein
VKKKGRHGKRKSKGKEGGRKRPRVSEEGGREGGGRRRKAEQSLGESVARE